MAEVSKVIRMGDDLFNLIDSETKLLTSFSKVTEWWDGTPMTPSKADGYIYRRRGVEYFLKNIGEYGKLFLEKDTMQEMRDLSNREVLLLQMGYYVGVKLNGYYEKGDTPAPINYFVDILGSVSEDDGGSIIELSEIALKHDFIKTVDVKYFGVFPGEMDNANLIQNVLNYIRSGITIVFNQGVYNIGNIVSINNKQDFIIDFSDSNLNDLGKDSFDINDVSILIPNGFIFNNCSNFKIKNFTHTTSIPAVAQPILRPDQYNERFPMLGFYNCNNLEVINLGTGGRVGARIGSDDASSVAEVLKCSSFHANLCNNITIRECYILPGNPGGETYSFSNCSNGKIIDCYALHGGSPQSFWSFGNIMDCQKFLINNIQIDSLSEGSLFDFSGDGLLFINSQLNYPNGKVIDAPGEWGNNLFTTFKNVKLQNITTTGELYFHSGPPDAGSPIVDYDNIVIDNCHVIGRDGDNNITWNRLGGTKSMKFSNIIYKNKVLISRYFSINPAYAWTYDKDLFLDNIEVLTDINSNSYIDNGGNLFINNSKFISTNSTTSSSPAIVFEDTYSKYHNNSLDNSHYKTVISNCEFNGFRIPLLSNITFINCIFKNCLFTTRNNTFTSLINPTVHFKNCYFELISGDSSITQNGSLFVLDTLTKITFNSCSIVGETNSLSDDGLIKVERTIGGVVEIINSYINVVRITGGGVNNLTYILRTFNQSVSEDQTIRIYDSNFKNVNSLVRVHGADTGVDKDIIIDINNCKMVNAGSMVQCSSGQSASYHSISIKNCITDNSITFEASDWKSAIIRVDFNIESVIDPNTVCLASPGSLFKTSSDVYKKDTDTSKTNWVLI